MNQVGMSAAAAWTRGPVPGCLWLWARLYQAVFTSECSHGLYSTVQYSTVQYMVCTVWAGYSVWPGYGGGRGACDS